MIVIGEVTRDQMTRAYVDLSRGLWSPPAQEEIDDAIEPQGATRIVTLSRFRYGPRLVQDTTTGATTVYVRGPLDGFWGFDANRMAERLDEVEPTSILLDVATPGGYTEEAALVFGDMLRRRDAGVPVNSRASGVVASAGATLFAAGQERTALASASFMVHAPFVLAFGVYSRRGAHRFAARMDALLGNEESRMAAMFRTAGIGREQVAAWLDDADHWMTPQEAHDAGLVTVKPDAPEDTAEGNEPSGDGEGTGGDGSEARNETQEGTSDQGTGQEPPAPVPLAVRNERFARAFAGIDETGNEEI